MAALLLAAVRAWPAPSDRLAEAAWLAALIVGAALVYLGTHVAARSEEVAFVRRAIGRRLGRAA
jgi:hypothetical protein